MLGAPHPAPIRHRDVSSRLAPPYVPHFRATRCPGPVLTRGAATQGTGPYLGDRVPDAVVGAAAVMVGQIAGAGRLVARVARPGARLVLDLR